MEITNEELVAQYLQGDELAFKEITNRTLGNVYSFALRFTGNESDAQDIAQETFVKAWRHLASYRPETSKFSTWLMRIAHNTAIDYLRKKKQVPFSSFDVEVIEITYDPEIISCERILEVFFDSHDPTTLNRQGNDIGPQYRSVIFYTTPQQQAVALHYLRTIQDAYAAPVTTTIEPLVMFYPAEAYHQEYYKMHANAPYCQLVIAPKIKKLTKQFPELIKPEP